MRKLVLLLFFVKLSFYAQNDSITVLLNSFKKKKETTYIKKALELAQKTNNDSIIREVNIVYGIQSYSNKDIYHLKKSYVNLKKGYEQFGDSLSLAKYFHYKALYFRRIFLNDSAFYYYQKSKNISNLIHDSLEVGRRLISMASLQRREKDYLGSEVTTIEALRYLEPIKAERYVASCYNNLGIIAKETENYEEARANYKKSFEIGYVNKQTKSLQKYIDYYNNLALCYHAEEKYLKSNEVYQAIIKDSIKKKDPLRYYRALGGVAYNNFKLGKNKLALNDFLRVLNYREQVKDTINLCVSYTILGEFYLSQKKYRTARTYALKGLQIAKKINNSDKLMYNYLYLSQIEKGEKGKIYLRKYIALNDSLTTNERQLKNQFAKVRYETEKKDIENNTLKAENQRKQLALEKEKQQKIIGWLFAAASLSFIAFGVVFVKNRRKKTAFEAKLQKVEAREKERQQIAKSLHDEVAGDIRMLHKKMLKKNLLEESATLNKVKENVRILSHQLSSVSFDEVSFKNQIINLVSDYFDADFTVKVHEINTIKWQEISNPIKRTLFLSIREAIQNIEKHANAKNVFLRFKEDKKLLNLTIIDDGLGFNVKVKKSGIGLKNMKERIEDINGVFSVSSIENKGTKITIEIPKNGK